MGAQMLKECRLRPSILCVILAFLATLLIARYASAEECKIAPKIMSPEMCDGANRPNQCHIERASIGASAGILFRSLDESTRTYFLSEIKEELGVSLQEIEVPWPQANERKQFKLVFVVSPYLLFPEPLDELLYVDELEGNYFIGDEGFPRTIPNAAKLLLTKPCDSMEIWSNLTSTKRSICDAVLISQFDHEKTAIVFIELYAPENNPPIDISVRRQEPQLTKSEVTEVIRACLSHILVP